MHNFIYVNVKNKQYKRLFFVFTHLTFYIFRIIIIIVLKNEQINFDFKK